MIDYSLFMLISCHVVDQNDIDIDTSDAHFALYVGMLFVCVKNLEMCVYTTRYHCHKVHFLAQTDF